MSVDMSVEGQCLLVLRIHGILRRVELGECERAASKLIREVGRADVLVLLEDFQGWKRTDEWGDVSFIAEHGSDIGKMAIVGTERWRDEALMFAGAPVRPTPIRYFNDSDAARAWLAERVP